MIYSKWLYFFFFFYLLSMQSIFLSHVFCSDFFFIRKIYLQYEIKVKIRYYNLIEHRIILGVIIYKL